MTENTKLNIIKKELLFNKIVIAIHIIFSVFVLYCIKKIYFDNGINSYLNDPITTKQFIFLTFFFVSAYTFVVFFYSIKIIKLLNPIRKENGSDSKEE